MTDRTELEVSINEPTAAAFAGTSHHPSVSDVFRGAET
jgi:hypothetical protein